MSVYCARVGDYVKIGYSADPARRLRNLLGDATIKPDGVAPGMKVELCASFPGERVDEWIAQGLLMEHHVCGEWFHDVPEVAAYFRERAAA